jgi:hypothetical protein
MTALTKFKHVCMRVMRVAESLVRVGLLPGQLRESSQFKLFGRTNLEIRCGIEYQL